ncbi:MAG: DUF202 domain-containing protein [Lewinellaceae bacterium]|nr:DUF202 domain-containing protein [Lewinella sp.]MCB9281484.1 DUF202 domain-containing protein [Lewinellaceae bacterium]HMQ89553.1 DUF202 domain-containing protein [Flavilitoribacter sp.]
MEEGNELIVRDWLAIERTKLANERTFLAYFRTAIVLFGTGMGIIKIELFSELEAFGIALSIMAPIIMAVGVVRLFHVKSVIKKHYKV